MFNPPHPGELVKAALGDIKIQDAAKNLGISQCVLSRLINGHTRLTPEMAARLSLFLGSS